MASFRTVLGLVAKQTCVLRAVSINNFAAVPRCMSTGQYENVIVDKQGEKKNVGVITLNRPKALNALNEKLMLELGTAISEFGNDKDVGAIVITGGEKVFAAGADIKQMANQTYSDVLYKGLLSHWGQVTGSKKPLIAAVNGYALGGGCELAMMCDIIYAGDKAKFGQPEILIGVIPGAGGTQRLTNAVGKSRAMEMCLTGVQITAKEAEHWGLVSRVFPASEVIQEAIKIGEKISSLPKISVALCKEAINTSFETTLHEGQHVERRLFHALFGTNDRAEGMKAFVEKRPPNFTDS